MPKVFDACLVPMEWCAELDDLRTFFVGGVRIDDVRVVLNYYL
jgi:hypothetical protein